MPIDRSPLSLSAGGGREEKGGEGGKEGEEKERKREVREVKKEVEKDDKV